MRPETVNLSISKATKLSSINTPFSPELEELARLMALSADIIRRIADRQGGSQQAELSLLAERLDEVSIRIVDLLFPSRN